MGASVSWSLAGNVCRALLESGWALLQGEEGPSCRPSWCPRDCCCCGLAITSFLPPTSCSFSSMASPGVSLAFPGNWDPERCNTGGGGGGFLRGFFGHSEVAARLALRHLSTPVVVEDKPLAARRHRRRRLRRSARKREAAWLLGGVSHPAQRSEWDRAVRRVEGALGERDFPRPRRRRRGLVPSGGGSPGLAALPTAFLLRAPVRFLASKAAMDGMQTATGRLAVLRSVSPRKVADPLPLPRHFSRLQPRARLPAAFVGKTPPLFIRGGGPPFREQPLLPFVLRCSRSVALQTLHYSSLPPADELEPRWHGQSFQVAQVSSSSWEEWGGGGCSRGCHKIPCLGRLLFSSRLTYLVW